MSSEPPAQALFDQALIEEATKKSGLIWVRGADAPAARPLWHVWHEGAALLVGDGPGEQPLPALTDGGAAEVAVRSKDKGGRLVTWRASVHRLDPASPEWQAAVAELKGKRLNAPGAEEIPARWARDCTVLRLVPTGQVEPPPTGSLAEPPLPTPATTRVPVPAALPRLLARRRKRG
ncbi:hypothetical protein ACFV1A_11200 [Streptomyces seoulensis]|uniref:Pyridoxamine 5'-phosphate oxidase family protein n=1 Tax=Streptomyces seoulensis TaxID=73044 RepID=A0A4P6TZU9_STRSO|nr:hypothetical protein [Streptomyces seoulensis]QBJ92204.1 hypothetical protein D0Z67_19185 [Streptomyces seoulensis]